MILSYTKGTHCLFSVLCFLLCISPINTPVLWWYTGWEVVWGLLWDQSDSEVYWLSTQTLVGAPCEETSLQLHLSLVWGNDVSDVKTQTSQQQPPSKTFSHYSNYCQNWNFVTDCVLKATLEHIMYCINNWPFPKACHFFFFFRLNKGFLHSKHRYMVYIKYLNLSSETMPHWEH